MRTIVPCSTSMAVGLFATACTPPIEDHGPAAVVTTFNEAITRQDTNAALALIAAGSVQFNLHGSHANMGEQTELTQDLASLWQVVSTVLFNTLESYEREVEVLDVDADGDVATVWTATRTVSLEPGETNPTVFEFSEVYLLLRTRDAWKIAGVANNRPATAP